MPVKDLKWIKKNKRIRLRLVYYSILKSLCKEMRFGGGGGEIRGFFLGGGGISQGSPPCMKHCYIFELHQITS